MPKKKAKPKKPVVTKFKVGDQVRVRHGVTDTDYPDMPLSGWAGTIHEIHKDGMYTVRWNRETLAAIHPVFKKLTTSIWRSSWCFRFKRNTVPNTGPQNGSRRSAWVIPMRSR